MSAPRRNVELKATDPDPARSLAVCLELGATDEGTLVQRDTYFRVPEGGRLKLREETPGGAALIQYFRADRPEARESRYRVVPVDEAEATRHALADALGTLAVVDKERHLFLWEGVRIHLDTVQGLGSFIELEGVAPEDSDLSGEHGRVAELSEALGIDASRILKGSYSDLVIAEDSEQLIAAARAVFERAYAPYSRYRVGVALRAPDGSVHVGANVENAAYPLGNCAEASAIGAMVAAGRTEIIEAAVIGDGEEPCVPCGGCRQRLREFMPLDATVHLIAERGARASMTLEELLPRSFGPEYLP